MRRRKKGLLRLQAQLAYPMRPEFHDPLARTCLISMGIINGAKSKEHTECSALGSNFLVR